MPSVEDLKPHQALGRREAAKRLDEGKGQVFIVEDEDGSRWPLMRRAELEAAGMGSLGKRTMKKTFEMARCGVIKTWGAKSSIGKPCWSYAGTKTNHEGVGPCYRHGGNRPRVKAEGAWLMAHAFSQELNVSPWDALLMAVRIAAGKLQYAQQKIGTATHDLELEGRIVRGEDGVLQDPDTGEPIGVGNLRDLSFWVKQADMWHERLAKTSKLAIDAGVAEKMVQAQILQVQLLARPVEAALAVLGLSPEQEALARGAIRSELMKIEQEQMVILEGDVIVGSHDSRELGG
jgi:hypothetical protein